MKAERNSGFPSDKSGRSATRAFVEASLPAWVILAGLQIFSRGKVEGNLALLNLLALVFPGIWGAWRFPRLAESWLRTILAWVAFSVALGAGVVFVMLGTLLALRFTGLYSGTVDNAAGKLLLFGAIPGVTFILLRMMIDLPSIVVSLWRRRGLVLAGAGLIAVLAAVAGAGYWLISQPYTGHASRTEPSILAASPLADFHAGAAGWHATDSSVSLQVESETLRLASTAQTLSYTVTWPATPGELADFDGFRVRARSDAAAYLTVDVKETPGGGGVYRSWADLPPGDWKTLYLSDFLPSLNNLDADSKLDWQEVGEVSFIILNYGAPGSDVWLDDFEAVRADGNKETPWLQANTEHFWIRYHASDQRAVADVQKAAEAKFQTITSALGFSPRGRVPITIVSNHAELEQRQGGTALPAWVIAGSLPDSLLFLTPSRFSPQFNNRRYESVFELVPHEFTHLLVAQILGYAGTQAMPLWLHEGLAVYLANQRIDEQALREAARQGKLPSLDELNKSFSGQAEIGDSYGAAGSATRYLIETYGADKIPRLLETMARGVSFDGALRQAAGIDSESFEQGWRDQKIP